MESMRKLARGMRRQATDAERLLWMHLRSRNLAGFKFRRQVVIEPYIADFVCFEAKLIIEVDGGQHAVAVVEDVQRTNYLKNMEYRVLRFWNHEVLNSVDVVLEQICRCLHPSPQPSP